MCSLARAQPPANRGAAITVQKFFCVFGLARPDNLAFDFFRNHRNAKNRENEKDRSAKKLRVDKSDRE
jgi:hypothetical protein